MTTSFPETAIGGHLAWYFDVRVRGEATADEIDSHFAPDYRWDWGSPREPKALEQWFARWRNMHATILKVEELGPTRFVVATRIGTGGIARVWFEMEPDPPHRIWRTATSEAKHAEEAGDVARDTNFERVDDGVWRGTIHPAFTTANGPYGGYLAALAVRAAGLHSEAPVPHTLACHFLNVGRAGPLDAVTRTLRQGSRLHSVAVDLQQEETVLLSALVWAGTEPSSHALPSEQHELAGRGGRGFASFGGGMIVRGTDSEEDGAATSWAAFNPSGVGADLWLDAARLLFPFDSIAVQAANRFSPGSGRQPQTLDTTFTFFNPRRHTEWVHCRATAEVTSADLAMARVTITSEAGDVLGIGTQQVLRRSMAGRAPG